MLGALVIHGRRCGAMVGVHDDIDAVILAGSGAVHLPSGSNPAAVRSRLPRALIGASAHCAEEASALLQAGADYVTVSPVFVTASKPGYGPALGLDGLASVVAQAPGPVIALGGVTAENAGLCRAAGAHGVAVMGEVMRATNPRAAVETLLQSISSNEFAPGAATSCKNKNLVVKGSNAVGPTVMPIEQEIDEVER